jgi:hypothetical protein
MSGTRFQFKVLGEGKVRARGELAFVLPQALDLVSKTAYVASISEVMPAPPGVLRLWRGKSGIEARYIQNLNLTHSKPDPAWLGSIDNLSGTLGRTITWQTVT